MNAESLAFESVCESFKNEFNKFFDWNDVDVTYFCVNIKTKKMHIASNNYEWQLIALENNVDKLIEERLKSNIQYWSNYSDLFKKILSKSKKNKCKVDFCNRYDNTFEITTINTNRELCLDELLAIYKIRPEIAEFSHQKWKQNPEIALPMRAILSPDAKLIGQEKGIAADLLSTQKYLRFGNIRLTQKEMLTIRLLLSQRSIKEISYIQGCTTVSEHKRIQNIKEKLGCPYASLSGLFAELREQGITLACLDVLMELPEMKIDGK